MQIRLLKTGTTDAQEMVEDDSTQEFASKFYDVGALIGAISIAPILLLKIGYFKGKPFMIGVEKSDLYEEGFTYDDMKHIIGWEKSCDGVVPEKHLKTDNIIISVAFRFRLWAMAIGRELNIELWPKGFDL